MTFWGAKAELCCLCLAKTIYICTLEMNILCVCSWTHYLSISIYSLYWFVLRTKFLLYLVTYYLLVIYSVTTLQSATSMWSDFKTVDSSESPHHHQKNSHWVSYSWQCAWSAWWDVKGINFIWVEDSILYYFLHFVF